MRVVFLLASVFASVASAYYYEVDVMAFDQDKWFKCVNVNTYDFKGVDPSTGKPWPGIGGECQSSKDPAGEILVFPNTDWRLNQFYNVTITPGDVYNQVPSLKTKETGLIIPCILADEYHAPPNTTKEELPYGFPNHWLYACIAPELFHDRTVPIAVPTTTAIPTTFVPVPTVVPNTTVKHTTIAKPTTTVEPKPTCLPGYKGKLNGDGPNGACCSSSDDCYESCIKGVCKVDV